MRFWEKIRLNRMVRCFAKGFLRCEQCRNKVPITDLEPLSTLLCPKCQNVSMVPMNLDDFWLHRPLGEGGIGSVYLAYWRKHRAACAVKILQRGERDRDAALALLQREANAIAQIGHHQCVVRSIGSGFDGDEFFIAMDYIEGERLDLRIARQGMMPQKEALRLLLGLIAAEKHIYQQGFIFADMKPENIIINKIELPVMIDFGLCMTIEEAAVPRKRSFVGGSPYYLPPERLRRAEEGVWSEIYSMGMVIFNSLTGGTFFKFNGSVQDLAMKHAQTARMPVTQATLPQCHPLLVKMLDQMVKKDPDARFQTFEELEQTAFVCLQTVQASETHRR